MKLLKSDKWLSLRLMLDPGVATKYSSEAPLYFRLTIRKAWRIYWENYKGMRWMERGTVMASWVGAASGFGSTLSYLSSCVFDQATPESVLMVGLGVFLTWLNVTMFKRFVLVYIRKKAMVELNQMVSDKTFPPTAYPRLVKGLEQAKEKGE